MDIAFLDSRWFDIPMAPKRILYIAPSVGIGGVETFLKHVSQYHTSAYEPYFLLFDQGPLGHWLEANEATVFYSRKKPRLSRPWTWLSYRAELLSVVRNNNIDIVHSSQAYGALFSWPSSFVSKHIWFQHGPVSGWMDWIAYRVPASAVLFNSDYTLKRQLTVSGDEQNSQRNNVIIPLGTPVTDQEFSFSAKQKILQQYQIEDGCFIISMACRLQRWKGVHIAIEAFAKLTKSVKRPTALIIYGDAKWDETYYSELKVLAKDLPVYISDPVNDVTPVFLASDVVINASTIPEPFGFTVIEAMACGALPIAPRSGGPKEILEGELPDCLFESGNSDDLCAKIKNFVEDPDHFLKAKSKSQDLFEKNYTVESMIGQLESCYSKLFS